MKNKLGIFLWVFVIACALDILHFLPQASLSRGWSRLFSAGEPGRKSAKTPQAVSLNALSELPSTVGGLKTSLNTLAASLLLLKQTDEEMEKTLSGTRRLNGLLSDEERMLKQAVVYLKPLALHSAVTNKLTMQATRSTQNMEKTIKNSANVSGNILKETKKLYLRAKSMRDSMADTLVAMQNVKNKLPKNLPK